MIARQPTPACPRPFATSTSPWADAHDPAIGTLPQRLREQAGHGLDVLVVDLDVEQLAQFLERIRAGTRYPPSGSATRLGRREVVLVLHLADDLLERVLDGDEAGDAAVFVDDDCDVDASLCIRRSRSSTGTDSGTYTARRMNSSTGSCERRYVVPCRLETSLRYSDAHHVVNARRRSRARARSPNG